jgi:CubicO group peptidase (beta-lactamase class C family)
VKQIVLVIVLCLSACAFADKADDIVRAEMAKGKIPGVAVAVIQDGKQVKVKGYGYSNIEHKVPVKPETIFQSGSMGKQFTAALAMMLMEEGKLSLSDKISKYLTEGAGKWDDITVRHLLTHTSGLPDLPYGAMDMRKDYTEEDLVKFLVDKNAVEKPGEKWRYNNGGYVMLGVLLGRVGGKFYGDQLAEKIFKPLGMNTARIITESDIVPNRAAGYVPVNGQLKNHEWVAPKLNTTADGSLYWSILDLIKWDAALYTEKLLKKSSLEMMWTPVKLNDGKTADMRGSGYGFGWAIGKHGANRMLHHGGAWQGFTTWIGRVPEKKTTVIVLGNLAGGNTEGIGRKLLEHYLPAKQ